ncbi:hypothetical protein AB6A40_000208 [Gnathostoma spinigerum]|uniref:Tyrosine specific protein phosphatases domain-containing protein n=1 Tax=Gnathostoma spinigerum TaxID=75299 RepID=A0ABD6E1L8_9BILA
MDMVSRNEQNSKKESPNGSRPDRKIQKTRSSESGSNHDNRSRHRHLKRQQGSAKLPKRWLIYRPIGKAMLGTRFFAFKTPLRSTFYENNGYGFKTEDIFEVKTLLRYVGEVGRSIGLIVDLTATDRYYDSKEWTDAGVEYVKISCFGHTAHRQVECAERFYTAVTDFLQRNADNSKLVGVHCTHGINRTGYLICKYLVEVDGWDPKTAIKYFEYCRGYEIEREEYVNSLILETEPSSRSLLSVKYADKVTDPVFPNQSVIVQERSESNEESCEFISLEPKGSANSVLNKDRVSLK